MKYLFSKTLLLLAAMTVGLNTFASHYAGGYFGYSTTNGTNYTVSLTLYRDCQGLPASGTLSITAASAMLSSSQNVTLNLSSTSSVPMLCASQQAQSSCSGGALPGIQKVVYTGSVALPGTSADWKLTFTECCRSGAISNLQNPSSQGTMIYAWLNNNYTADSSPTFFEDPVFVIPAGQAQHLSWTAIDADGDQLIYNLTGVLNDLGANISFAGGYSFSQPIASSPAIQFNNDAGDLYLTPSVTQTCVVSMTVAQFRTGVMVGIVQREVMVTVVNSTNQLPLLFDFNNGHHRDTTLCVGQPMLIQVFSNDTAAAQILTAEWDSIPGATYTISGTPHPTGTVSWMPSLNDTGFHAFAFRVRDDNCPLLGSNSYPIAVSVVACLSSLSATASYNTISCNGQLTTIVVSATGGSSPYAYSIDGGITWQSSNVFPNLPAGNYTIIVMDANSDTYNINVVITEPTPVVVSIANDGDGVLPDTITANVSGGCMPYVYMWTGNVTQTFYVVIANGTYDLTVVDACGCTATQTYNTACVNQCVWPGDADYNGVVDQYDLLPLGIMYAYVGTDRPNASLNWVAQPSADWPYSLPNGTNAKHSDCDGDSLVLDEDTLAITQNWSLTHNKKQDEAEWRGGVPGLTIVLTPDTLEDGDTAIAELFLGDANNTADNVYSLAFNFNFDNEVVDSTYIQFNYSDSWLVDVGDHISLQRTIFDEGRIGTALTRIDHSSRTGFGSIGTIEMKVTTGNINGKQLDFYQLQTWISNLVVWDENGTPLTFSEGSDSTTLQFDVTGIQSQLASDNSWRVFPVPAKGVVQVSSLAIGSEGTVLELINHLGEKVMEMQPSTPNFSLNISQLPAGIYLMRYGHSVRKLVLQP